MMYIKKKRDFTVNMQISNAHKLEVGYKLFLDILYIMFIRL